MKLQHIALVCLLALSAGNVTAQMLHRPDSMYTFTDPRLQKKHPWRAAAETFGMNVGVWAFDRYVMNEDFAKISIGSIRRNIKHGFVWDNDQFSTNLFAHPYHGNLYFNAARSNGLTFWESAPYAFAGSLMWEIAAEVEPPAINDLMATTLGGIALGEVTHRMSSLVLDDSKRGFSRFTREFLGTLICPMRGLNRMITGEMWKVKRSHYKYHDYDRIPVHFSIGAGDRYLADDNYLFRGEHNPYLEFRVQYGDAFDKVNDGPYDYFTARATFGLSGNQPLISQINLMGKLWGVPLKTTTGMEMMFGIFQHFNYFDSEEERLDALKTPADLYIINRENIDWLVNNTKFDYDMVVIDELSSFKSHQSKRFKALMKVRPNVKRIVGLTGTPTSSPTSRTAISCTPTSLCPMQKNGSTKKYRTSRFR